MSNEQEGQNGLKPETLQCIGHLLEFATIPGWNWEGTGGHVPPKFQANLLEIIYSESKREGGIARVASPGHQFDGWYVEFHTRTPSSYDFIQRLGAYVLWLSKKLPRKVKVEGTRVAPEVIGWVKSIRCLDSSHKK